MHLCKTAKAKALRAQAEEDRALARMMSLRQEADLLLGHARQCDAQAAELEARSAASSKAVA